MNELLKNYYAVLYRTRQHKVEIGKEIEQLEMVDKNQQNFALLEHNRAVSDSLTVKIAKLYDATERMKLIAETDSNYAEKIVKIADEDRSIWGDGRIGS